MRGKGLSNGFEAARIRSIGLIPWEKMSDPNLGFVKDFTVSG